jgi:hypothetical protein
VFRQHQFQMAQVSADIRAITGQRLSYKQEARVRRALRRAEG